MWSTDTIPVINIETLINQFSEVIKNQQYEKITNLLETQPNSFELHFLDGSYHAELGDYQKAKLAFERSLKINPNFHISRFQLCFLSILNEDYVVFNKHIEQLLMLRNSNYLTFFSKALLNIHNDDIEQAKIHLHQGLILNKENIALNENMNQLLSLIDVGRNIDSGNNQRSEEELTISNNSILLDIYKNKFN